MHREGTLKTWNDERGFGFIEPMGGGPDVFVHIRAFADRSRRPVVGQKLTFEFTIDPQGRERAEKVRAQRSIGNPFAGVPRWGFASVVALVGFVALYVGITLVWGVPIAQAGFYLGASVVCFGAYALDKSAAQRGAWRTPESTLHLFGLVGGWPGAIVAQQTLRHKSKKTSFRIVFWLTVLLNVAAFVVINTPLAERVQW